MNQLIKNGELHLYGTVGGDLSWDEDGIKTTGFTDEQVIDALGEMQGDVAVRLNSGGGIAFQGIAIYNALREHSGKVTVYVDALAASAASVIAMAGDRVVMRAGALMMIHNPGTITIGTAEDHRKSIQALEQIAEAAADIYAGKSGASRREILRMMQDESWLRGAAAKSLGFADEIDEGGEEMAAPAFKYSLFKNAPPELLTAVGRGRGPVSTQPEKPAARKEPVMTQQSIAKDATNEIFARCRSAKLSMDETEKVIAEAKGDSDKARDIIINMLADRSGPEIIGHLPSAALSGATRSPQIEKQIEDAMVIQMGGRIDAGGENPFIGRSVMENVRAYHDSLGISTRGMSDLAVADMVMGVSRLGGVGSRMTGGMHATSDFPSLMGSALYRFISQRFGQYASPLKQMSIKRNLADFRKHNYIRPGESPELEEVIEGGDVKYGTLEEEANGLTLKTYAKIFAISRQALINDDLSALASAAVVFADGARKLENKKFWELLSANSLAGATMDDGLPFFHADHGNIHTTGAAISVESLTIARQGMRLQKDVNKTGNAGVTPAIILVGPKQETAAEQLVAQITAAKASDANPFAGKLTVAVENQYEGTDWWLFADPQDVPAFQHGYLGGAEGPQLQQRDGWNTLGVEYRCVLDFGCAPFEYRAGYKMKGL
ncbi:Clp protease ClpP [Rhizobium sp. S-51]|uniref:Clp protease ClpP n=1 Tax=Rhizobium terricola TaxID=2728849 RepID=A0A7Y0FX38_9HYPH|nr:head maturation protease, ClpP-related [Rhizobium terricola]NML75269.1 Clp protease ClpP [Rhizobium terricola]